MRVPGWEARLLAWVHRHHGQPFAWGERDCALLCLEAVDVLRGTRHAAAYRGRYRTLRQAVRLCRREAVTLSSRLHAAGVFPVAGVALAGDVLIHPNAVEGLEAGYVCLGAATLGANAEQGCYLTETRHVMGLPGVGIWRVA